MKQRFKEVAMRYPGFVAMGIICGYPPCCIIEFCNTFDTAETRAPRKFYGTGYVPCLKCNEKSILELKAEISLHRDPRMKPFPNDTQLQKLLKSG